MGVDVVIIGARMAETPTFDIVHVCDECKAVISRRRVDVRNVVDAIEIAEQDGALDLEHVERHEREHAARVRN